MSQTHSKIRAAVIDIGSNSIKFLLGQQSGTTLTVHREEARTTRLGAALAHTRLLSKQSIAETLHYLEECRHTSIAFGADTIVAVGTSALREAENPQDLLAPGAEILGHPIRVVSGKQEGELVYAGITSHHRWKKTDCLAIDVGGGSVEFVHGSRGKLQESLSYRVGCVIVRDLFFRHHPPNPAQIQLAREYIRTHIGAHAQTLANKGYKILGSGGTMIVLTAYDRLRRHLQPRFDLEGIPLTCKHLEEIAQDLLSRPIDAIRRIPVIPPSRADIVASGATILWTVAELLETKILYCATRALRYGVWRNWVALEPYSRVVYTEEAIRGRIEGGAILAPLV